MVRMDFLIAYKLGTYKIQRKSRVNYLKTTQLFFQKPHLFNG